MRRFFQKNKEARRPEVYEILALAQFRSPTSTYCPRCLTQIEDTRGADSEPEPDRAAYGLQTLYDCSTAEVEYDMTWNIEKNPRANEISHTVLSPFTV